MNDFMFRIVHIKHETTKAMSQVSLITYAMPFVMLGMVYGMFAMLATDTLPTEIAGTELPFQPIDPDAGIQEQIGGMVAAIMIPMGLIAAKLRSYTILDTTPLITVCILTITALIATPLVIDMVMVE